MEPVGGQPTDPISFPLTVKFSRLVSPQEGISHAPEKFSAIHFSYLTLGLFPDRFPFFDFDHFQSTLQVQLLRSVELISIVLPVDRAEQKDFR